jgi:uncharacterized protein YhbP (UPF0306 family)
MSQKNKEMPEEILKKHIKKFLNKRKVLVLCTCKNDVPRATPLDFYTDDETFNIYMGPTPGRKIENIKQNPVVSIGIYTPLSEGKIQGMQITAKGKEHLIFLENGDKGFKAAQKIVRGKRKLILKIIPENIELLDYDFPKDGYSRFQTLNL